MHRFLWATLLGAAAFLITSALAGLVQAADDPAAERLVLPAPRSGDEAMYATKQVRFDSRWNAVPYVLTDGQMAWSGPTRATDAQGVEHDVMELRIRAGYRWSEPAHDAAAFGTVYYDVDSREPVQVVSHENFPETVPGGPLNNNVNVAGNTVHVGDGSLETDAWYRVAATEEWLGPCGLWSPLHTVEGIALDEPVHLGGSCDNERPTGDEFLYDGRETVAGVEAYRFQNTQDPEVRLWYAPGIAFPVKMREHFSDLLNPRITNGWVFEWTLTGVRNAGSTPGEPSVLPGALPTSSLVAGMPADDGTANAFPLSAAVAAANDGDDSFSSLLARPDTYIGHAWQEATEDGAGRLTWTWELIVTDGNVWRGVRVTLPPADPRLAPMLGDAPLLAPTPEVEPWAPEGLPGSVEGIYPTKAQLPAGMPTVASVYAAFEQASFRSGERPAERWGAWHHCYGDCTAPTSIVFAGVLRYGDTEGALAAPPLQQQWITFGADGRLLEHAERTENLTAGPLLDLAGQEPAEAAARPTATTGAGWQTPTPATLVVLGAASVAAGLAVWLWPAAKAASAGIGLFSRTQEDRLLEHKGRAAIVGAVEAEPGVHFQELSRRTGIAAGALRHHLRKLETAGLLVAKPLGGYSCYFVPRQAADRGLQANALSKSEGAQQVLAALHRGVTGVRAIAAETGLSPSTVSHHMARLRAAGLLPGEAGQAAA